MNISNGLALLLGIVVTWLVAWYYFRKGADSVRWEARASHFSHVQLRVLVAYYKWGKHLREGQCFTTPGFGNVTLRLLKKWFAASGLMNDTYCLNSNLDTNCNEVAVDNYHSMILSSEGSALAEYLIRYRRIVDEVDTVYTHAEGGGLLERIWSRDPQIPLGPVCGPAKITPSPRQDE